MTRKRKLLSVVRLFIIFPLVKSSGAFCLDSLDCIKPEQKYQLQARSRHPTLFSHRKKTALHHKLRGGALLRSTTIDLESRDDETPDERWRRRGMTAALSSTYFAVMGAKCALPSVLPLLISPENGLSFTSLTSSSTPQVAMARLLGLSTLAIALGKSILGPMIDALGGIRSLQLAICLLISLLSTITFTQNFSMFALCWILVDFIFSSCWAGCINGIHQSFPENEWGKQIGFLAAGARTGNAFAFALFASVLHALEGKVKQPWRVVFGVSALLQILPMTLLTYFGRLTLQNKKKIPQSEGREKRPSLDLSLLTVRQEARKPEFWLHLVARSCLMVFASFLLFVPTLMSQVYQVSNAFAAQTGSIFALGCLLSVSFGSQLYSKLPKKRQALMLAGLLGTATVSSLAQLAHVSGVTRLSANMSAFFIFLWGFAFSIPFYIPPSLYALSRGGKRSSATIADIFDVGGFGILALFNRYVASIQHANPASWIGTFQLTTACSLASLVSLVLAVLLQ